ncbi:mitochondrial 2-enoyl thioester reductase [Scheffersomyces coipomensis]|uniref:mitochondrial 2-enoyl thioester reductase n=1 Tax=Scheffersomyces coipomensis TaxID=1788519 RepID=UPI00315CA32E
MTKSDNIIEANAVTFTERGFDFANVLHSTKYSIDPTKLKSDELIVKALTTSINPSDLGIIGAAYGAPPKLFHDLQTSEPVHIPGNETLLRVEYVGSDIKDYKVGDWVIPKNVGFGSWRSHAVVSTAEDKTPLIVLSNDEDDSFTLEQGATIMINPCTAYQILGQFIHDWKDDGNDWVIQNAGNSQVAKYLTQFTTLKNIKSISVIRDGKSDEEIKELYDLGATKVITESEFLKPEFIKETLPSWIGSKGNVRLAINSVGGPTTAQLVSSLSQDGYFVTFGMIGGQPISYNGGEQLQKNITTKAYWLTANTKRDPESKVKTVVDLLKLYKDGKLKDVPFEKNIVKVGVDDIKSVFLQGIVKSKTNGKQIIVYE